MGNSTIFAIPAGFPKERRCVSNSPAKSFPIAPHRRVQYRFLNTSRRLDTVTFIVVIYARTSSNTTHQTRLFAVVICHARDSVMVVFKGMARKRVGTEKESTGIFVI